MKNHIPFKKKNRKLFFNISFYKNIVKTVETCNNSERNYAISLESDYRFKQTN